MERRTDQRRTTNAANRLTLAEARRIALAAQGFDHARPSGRIGRGHLRRLIRQLGLLQIDFVNVLIPAQYQVPFSRLGPYDTSQLDDLVYRRREFTEQWAREASIVPMGTWPLLRYRMETGDRRWHAMTAFMQQHRAYVGGVLEHIRAKGPLAASEIPEPDGKPGKRGDFWGWTKAKAAVEGYFSRGVLAIADRRPIGFARIYDLAERVIPLEHFERAIDREDAQRQLLRIAARAHGVGTADDLADYFRIPIREARLRLAELAASNELREVAVEGWDAPAYLHPKAARPDRLDACALLSPFDPVVWSRRRAQRLFDFDYVLEIWVPATKRRWGYYVMPFLLGERLVARVDVKADRAAKRLLVQAAFVEAHAKPDRVAPPLAAELRTMARWLGLAGVVVSRRGNLARPLAVATRGRG